MTPLPMHRRVSFHPLDDLAGRFVARPVTGIARLAVADQSGYAAPVPVCLPTSEAAQSLDTVDSWSTLEKVRTVRPFAEYAHFGKLGRGRRV